MQRITEWHSPRSKIRTQYGRVKYSEWLELEAARIGGDCLIRCPNEDEIRRAAYPPHSYYVALFRSKNDFSVRLK